MRVLLATLVFAFVATATAGDIWIETSNCRAVTADNVTDEAFDAKQGKACRFPIDEADPIWMNHRDRVRPPTPDIDLINRSIDRRQSLELARDKATARRLSITLDQWLSDIRSEAR
jgi:hypothetical protein